MVDFPKGLKVFNVPFSSELIVFCHCAFLILTFYRPAKLYRLEIWRVFQNKLGDLYCNMEIH